MGGEGEGGGGGQGEEGGDVVDARAEEVVGGWGVHMVVEGEGGEGAFGRQGQEEGEGGGLRVGVAEVEMVVDCEVAEIAWEGTWVGVGDGSEVGGACEEEGEVGVEVGPGFGVELSAGEERLNDVAEGPGGGWAGLADLAVVLVEFAVRKWLWGGDGVEEDVVPDDVADFFGQPEQVLRFLDDRHDGQPQWTWTQRQVDGLCVVDGALFEGRGLEEASRRS